MLKCGGGLVAPVVLLRRWANRAGFLQSCAASACLFMCHIHKCHRPTHPSSAQGRFIKAGEAAAILAAEAEVVATEAST